MALSVRLAREGGYAMNKHSKRFYIILLFVMSLAILYVGPYIFLFSKETRTLNSITAKHNNLESLCISLKNVDYHYYDPYRIEDDMLVMNISYNSNRPFVDLLFVWFDFNFRISPASYLVYADKNGDIIKTEHAGGIVF